MRFGPKYKICRRVGDKVFPQCQTTKFSISGSAASNETMKRGGGRGRSSTDYGAQLTEKQKARYTYGLNERQFRNYVRIARQKVKRGNPAPLLYQLLEERLDNVVFRAGLAPSRAAGRQLVSHGHIFVNGRRVTIPSIRLAAGDVVALRPQSMTKGIFRDLEEKLKDRELPNWLIWDETKKSLAVKARPVFGEMEANINFPAIVEFYSRV